MAATKDGLIEPDPAIGISMEVEVSKGRRLVLQTHVARDAPIGELNGTLDKINTASDRQVAYYELDALRFQLEHDERVLKQFRDNYVLLEQTALSSWERRGKRGPVELSDREQKGKMEAETSIERMTTQIGAVKARIAEFEAKVKNTSRVVEPA